ncbi:endo alpha-1,4 polygalactosaminidase [Pseudokineococcus sp. 1T1Z-3]|uniref:endo alpha-1,4 polygalactosaminidase n=1 Tax=Pseudokineococcus sp. 1T1Z-3 TaxID=3132745 RepID=UPI0030D85A45
MDPVDDRRLRRTSSACAVAAGLVLVLASAPTGAASGFPTPSPTSTTSAGGGPGVRLPPVGAGFDYQLGGPYPPAPGVRVVVRDRTEPPAGVGYDVCYVNGFQTQPGESAALLREHPDLVLHVGGKPLVDPGWPDEYLFDTSTPARRAALVELVRPWVHGCADDGYDAVEIDNLDSFTRSSGRLSADDNLALAADYAALAHDAGLAIGQKNTAEETARVRAAGYDFAVTESCVEFEECGTYLAHYDVVLDVEYVDELGADAFPAACADPDRPSSMVLRDHDLLTPGEPGFVVRHCPGSAGPRCRR